MLQYHVESRGRDFSQLGGDVRREIKQAIGQTLTGMHAEIREFTPPPTRVPRETDVLTDLDTLSQKKQGRALAQIAQGRLRAESDLASGKTFLRRRPTRTPSRTRGGSTKRSILMEFDALALRGFVFSGSKVPLFLETGTGARGSGDQNPLKPTGTTYRMDWPGMISQPAWTPAVKRWQPKYEQLADAALARAIARGSL